MEINSFVVTVEEFFLMNRNREPNFDSSYTRYVIPKYQREYKWTAEKAHTLITDINNRDKFLGNLILNCTSNYYEIVDGQQRITTILLILLALFNKNKPADGSERSEEQRDLLRYIFKNGTDKLILENETIGTYLRLQGNEIILSIDDAEDIYYQKDTFRDLYELIVNDLNEIDDLDQFQRKVLDCQLLVLVGDTRGRQNDSIEEIFLDINFKSQLLDVADIFKGYCFKNYKTPYHNELKELWTKIRRCMKEFESIGYVNVNPNTDGCPYLYLYLLSRLETHDIPLNLSPNGKHYLENKNHTETKKLLTDMAEYGKHILDFISNLSNEGYFFTDICSDAVKYREDIVNHKQLRSMYQDIMKNTKVQYHKLPLFMVLHYLLKNEELRGAFSYEAMKKFLTNYYAYSFLFINSRGNKNKSRIDQTMFSSLYQIDNGVKPKQVVDDLLKAAKELRRNSVVQYKHFTRYDDKLAEAIYSLMDYYSAADNLLKRLYRFPDFNKEHLIVHNNRFQNVTWMEDGNSFQFKLNELMGKGSSTTYLTNGYKKLSANYIILPKELNEEIEQDDIVEKVRIIKEQYSHADEGLPAHIDVVFSHIEAMDEFKKLSALKGQKKSADEIKDTYKQFVAAYFSDESQHRLCEQMETAFKRAFTNHTA